MFKKVVFLALFIILFAIALDFVLVFGYEKMPFIAIKQYENNTQVYYSIGYKVTNCGGKSYKSFIWKDFACSLEDNIKKFDAEILVDENCIPGSGFTVFYDIEKNIDYYVPCTDAIYIYDRTNNKKYSIGEIEESKLLTRKEVFTIIQEKVQIEQKSRESGLMVNFKENCDLKLQLLFEKDNKKIYANCTENILYNDNKLENELRNNNITISTIYEYIDFTSKYAQASKDILNNGFVYTNSLYTIVGCDDGSLIFTYLGMKTPHSLCKAIL